jgi:hypothetical protein
MNTCVDFRSDLFKPFLSDDVQVNPRRYGTELSWWFSRELAASGGISEITWSNGSP